MPKIILASKSPRRFELFKKITADFIAVEAEVDEGGFSALPVREQVAELARAKCIAVGAMYPLDIVAGFDTLVELGCRIYGKPSGNKDAENILKALSGNTHNVYTGVHIRFPDGETGFFCRTEVTFHEMSDVEIEEYIKTGDPFDKAGAYGIQGMAARYIKRINGDFFNVMGLPVAAVYREFRTRGIV